MTLCKYAFEKGMSLEEYEQLEGNIDAIADAIILNIKSLHKIDTGVYYPTSEIINPVGRTDLVPFIIIALKQKGVEFYDNNTLYRY